MTTTWPFLPAAAAAPAAEATAARGRLHGREEPAAAAAADPERKTPVKEQMVNAKQRFQHLVLGTRADPTCTADQKGLKIVQDVCRNH